MNTNSKILAISLVIIVLGVLYLMSGQLAASLAYPRSANVQNFGIPSCENGYPYAILIVSTSGKIVTVFGNYSEIKTILIYQHQKYGLNIVENGFYQPRYSTPLGTPSSTATLDEYLIQEDARCGPGSKIELPVDKLDPVLTHPPEAVQVSPTPYNYAAWGV